jgi:hypothetical protein
VRRPALLFLNAPPPQCACDAGPAEGTVLPNPAASSSLRLAAWPEAQSTIESLRVGLGALES